jgi:hypothetical protein
MEIKKVKAVLVHVVNDCENTDKENMANTNNMNLP